LLAIELVDELVFGAREAAWPQIRDDLNLDYVQVGILLALPILIANLIEVPVAFLGDTPRRKLLIVVGGLCFIAATSLVALSDGFWSLLAAFMLLAPASGAFVSLSQASLADIDTSRREQNMARWTAAGSLGVLAGSLVVGAPGSQDEGWRMVFLASAVVAGSVLALAARQPIGLPEHMASTRGPVLISLLESVRWAVGVLQRPDVLRWLALLELSDLVGDIMLGYLALYLVDVAGASELEAALGVALWTGGGLVGDLLVVMLLERMRGLAYLRLNSGVTAILLAAFLLIPDPMPKLAVVTALGCAIGGRYAILQAQLYDAVPGRSASSLALKNASNVPGSLLPAVLGAAAAAWGLGAAMWLLMAGPLALLVATPRAERRARTTDEAGREP
jgi:FSR family fosmidomycin resistance protein-like MFS transporter